LILQEILQLLEKRGYRTSVAILDGDDEKLWTVLVSNELWGGAGSIADQALLEYPEDRRLLDELLIRLGDEQIALGRINVRTEMWVDAFKKWKAAGIR
jgi:hypothetical protein